MMKWVMKMKLRIRDLREDNDLKQKQIADFLMCDQSLYSKYEREERALPLEYAVFVTSTPPIVTVISPT